MLRSSPLHQVGKKKKPKCYSGEHTPSFTELCKPHAIDSLIVMATPQECTLSDYEFIYLTWSCDLKVAVCTVTSNEDEKDSQNREEIHRSRSQDSSNTTAAGIAAPHIRTTSESSEWAPVLQWVTSSSARTTSTGATS